MASIIALRKQLEFYLSRENLSRDAYVRSHLNADGLVPLQLFATFSRVRKILAADALDPPRPDADLVRAMQHAVRLSSTLALGSINSADDAVRVVLAPDGEPAGGAGGSAAADGGEYSDGFDSAEESAAPVCKLFAAGRCQYGDRCRYAHPAHLAPTRRHPCKFHAAGWCRRGGACDFSHDDALCREYEAAWLAPAVPLRGAAPRPGDPPQELDVLIILDFEGSREIVEFPALALATATRQELGRFHRWVRPVASFGDHAINPASQAQPFSVVLPAFMDWVASVAGVGGSERRVSICTCGSWDLGTQLPHQLRVSGLDEAMLEHELFSAWVDIKTIFADFYKPRRRATGMRSMLGQLQMLSFGAVPGAHHLGMDDVANLTQILLRMMADGAVVRVTHRRGEGPDEGPAEARSDD